MKVKLRNEILRDIIRDAKKYPKGWNATFGYDTNLFSHDCYIFHPRIGIYLLKEYNKNPFEVKGMGSKLARRIDEDIEEQITSKSSDFGIIQGDIQKILRNINRGIPPQQILTSAMNGGDLGITMPVQGQASTSKDTFQNMKSTYCSHQKNLETYFEKMILEEGLYKSYE